MTNTYDIKNDNYAAEIVDLEEFQTLEGCDNVKAALIYGKPVIVSKDSKVGDRGIYFPPECAISEKFLFGNNLYSKPEMNSDETKKGFFESKGRVRTVRFRGHPSMGFWIPLGSIRVLGLDPLSFQNGDRFQDVNGTKVCWKFFVEPKVQNAPREGKKARRAFKKALKTCVVPGQLAFHYDTGQARRNAFKVAPNTIVSISDKWHGTSAIIGNLLLDVPYPTFRQTERLTACGETFDYIEKFRKHLKGSWAITRKVLGWGLDRLESWTDSKQTEILEKILKVRQYGLVCASRTVVKTAGPQVNTEGGFYGEDIWSTVGGEIEHLIPERITVYGEIVGFLGTGTHIQKNYDYGCKPKEHKFLVYRVTDTDPDGNVYEFSWDEMKAFCAERGLDCVVEHFYGTAVDFVLKNHPNAFNTLDWTQIRPLNAPEKPWKNPQEIVEDTHFETGPSFAKLFMEAVEHTFLEKDCAYCKNKVPNEGVVIRIDNNGLTPTAMKAKSYAFFALETKLADKGETNIEDQEAQGEEDEGPWSDGLHDMTL